MSRKTYKMIKYFIGFFINKKKNCIQTFPNATYILIHYHWRLHDLQTWTIIKAWASRITTK